MGEPAAFQRLSRATQRALTRAGNRGKRFRIAKLKTSLGKAAAAELADDGPGLRDGRGGRVPARCVPAFQRRAKAFELLADLERMRDEFSVCLHPFDPLWERTRLFALLQQAVMEIVEHSPYIVCPECKSDMKNLQRRCPTCGDKGWLTHAQWNATYGTCRRTGFAGRLAIAPGQRDGADDRNPAAGGRTDGAGAVRLGRVPGGDQQGPEEQHAQGDPGAVRVGVAAAVEARPNPKHANRRARRSAAAILQGRASRREVKALLNLLRDLKEARGQRGADCGVPAGTDAGGA